MNVQTPGLLLSIQNGFYLIIPRKCRSFSFQRPWVTNTLAFNKKMHLNSGLWASTVIYCQINILVQMLIKPTLGVMKIVLPGSIIGAYGSGWLLLVMVLCL